MSNNRASKNAVAGASAAPAADAEANEESKSVTRAVAAEPAEPVDPLALAALRRDAERYRWLRSEEVATNPRYYDFWQEFNVKLCREGKMDAVIDAAMERLP